MRKLALISGIVGIGLSCNAFANINDIMQANNQVLVQSIITNVDYTETGDGTLGTSTGILDTENGNVGGYSIGMSAMKSLVFSNDFVKINYSHNKGHTKYIGQLQSGGGYGSVVGTSAATMDDFVFNYGLSYDMNKNVLLTPYVEYATHNWDRGVNYGETYSHQSYGVGVLAQYSPNKEWIFSANALVGHTFDSNINVVNYFNGKLGNSSLYKYGFSVDYAFSDKWHGNVGVDYTEFKYGKSALYPIGSSVYWEPTSKTQNVSYKIGVSYLF